MGFLQDCQVIECSATDLIGQYVGQTGPKVQKLLDKALGRVLFVDEAYRLADGHFAKEAMDELVDSVTKDKYAKKLIIILAGYEKDINRLMSMNSGLTSRFPEVIDFRGLQPQECTKLLVHQLLVQRVQLAKKKIDLDISALEDSYGGLSQSLHELFDQLSQQDNWASARDVQTLAKEIFNKTIKDKKGIEQGRLVIRPNVVEGELKKMLQERAGRSMNIAPTLPFIQDLEALQRQPAAPLREPNAMTATTTSSATKMKDVTRPPPEESEGPVESPRAQVQVEKQRRREAVRDAGVSDAVWEQLQRDRRAEEEREQEYQDLLRAQREAREADREKIVRRLLEEEERRRKEAEARKKLAIKGACPVGFEWIRQAGGYRCAGGSHFMSDAAVASF